MLRGDGDLSAPLPSAPGVKEEKQIRLAISKLIGICHRTSKEHGWWDDYGETKEATIVMEKLALIHCEVSETAEEVRKGMNMTGIAEELADVLIRVFDLCGHLEINLGAAVLDKMAVNRLRPHRHGGKLA